MNDLDSTLTDVAVGVLSCFCVASFRTVGDAALRRWSLLFFSAVALASLSGAAVHGWFPAPDDPLGARLWTSTLLALAVAGFAGLGLAARVALAPGARGRALVMAGILPGLAAAAVLSGRDDFVWGVAGYLPGVLALCLAFLAVTRRARRTEAALGVRALLLMLGASALQQAEVGLDPDLLDHNALFHVLEGAALALLARALHGLLDDPTGLPAAA